jgi:N-acetylmuramoyl-L-alanine amidase
MSVMAAAVSIAMLGAPVVDKQQQECLAMNIYHEARGEVIEGQIAVAHVTMNRVKHNYWPETICEVVYQPSQFSWTHQISNHTPKEQAAYDRALVIARDVMIGNTVDPSNGATFYHANYVNPSWADQMTVSKVIGVHVFYTWDGTWD